MALWDLHLLHADRDFLRRCAACYATQPDATGVDRWTDTHAWALAATPGFADAYAYARATGVVNPGRDAAVITDVQILAAVQAVMAADPVVPVVPPIPDLSGQVDQSAQNGA